MNQKEAIAYIAYAYICEYIFQFMAHRMDNTRQMNQMRANQPITQKKKKQNTIWKRTDIMTVLTHFFNAIISLCILWLDFCLV